MAFTHALSTNNYGPAHIIVATTAANGTHTSIQGAINDATSGDTVFIRTGTYTEDLTLKPGVNLTAFESDSSMNETGNVKIIGGSILSSAGTVTLAAIQFESGVNFSNAVAITGSALCFLNLENCCFSNPVGNGGTILNGSSNASSVINIRSCTGDISSAVGIFGVTGGAIMNIYSSTFTNSLGTAIGTTSTITNGVCNLYDVQMKSAVQASLTTSVLNLHNCSIDTSALNSAGAIFFSPGPHFCLNSDISSGSGTAMTIGTGGSSTVANVSNCVINSSNATTIDGTGTLKYGSIDFTGSSSNVTVTTQVPLISSNTALHITTPGAYPYTTIPQDAVILVDTSSARTIVPLASPTTGQQFVIKDNVGSAAANNITITPSGKNIDGAASSTININYGSVTIVYNGTQWNII